MPIFVRKFVRELRFSARRLRRRPGFTGVAVLTLAVALGGCTAIYSVVHGVLLRPLPYPEPERLVHVWQLNRGRGQVKFSDPNFEDLRDRGRAFESFAQYEVGTTTSLVGESPLQVRTAAVSEQFFEVFRTEPRRGRGFRPEERREGAAPVALVSHGFWRDKLGGGTDLDAIDLRVGDQTVTVVGVLPPEHDFPAEIDLWTPRELHGRNPHRTGHNWKAVARLAPGLSLATAQAEVTAVARQLKRELTEETWMEDVELVPLREEITGSVQRPLLILLAAVACLLVIACANLTSLLTVHLVERHRELAIRTALGASRSGLAVPLFGEICLISLAGGLLGLGLGAVALRGLLAFEPGYLPRLEGVGVSWPVVGTLAAVMTLVAAGLGVAVTSRSWRSDLAEGLRQAPRGQTATPAATRLRGALVVAQIAVSLVLLIGAGLLGRSLALLLAEDPGFRTEGLLTVDLRSAPAEGEEGLAQRAQLYERALDRLGALPGVETAGGINSLPLGSGYASGRFAFGTSADALTDPEELQKMAQDPERTGTAEFRVASRGYFQAMGIPLIRGRLFDARDGRNTPHVAVISESLARTRWPDSDPLGYLVQFGNMDGDPHVLTLVGIVGDVRERGLDTPPRPILYASYRQRPKTTSTFTVVLQTSREPKALVPAIRSSLREIDPSFVPRFRSIEEVVASSVADRRFSLLVLAAFAGTALLLAVLGIYGVLAYAVSQRWRELGLRMALGAQRVDVWGLVLRQAVPLVGLGLGLGVVGALSVTRVLESLLYGVTATDLPTFAGVVAVLAGTALVACQIPALRATRADPAEALRAE